MSVPTKNVREIVMPNNPKQTSKKVAKKASELLKDPKSSAKVKSVSGSDLAQAQYKKKPPTK
jgi:hypothetical protein